MQNNSFEIELFFTIDKHVKVKKYQIFPGTSLDKFLKDIEFSQICNYEKSKFGVFGKFINLDYIIQPADRLEVYHPASKDPKKSRRDRAKSKKSHKP
tara:strand:- start:297 stop:587 length:291 start_codon:yes stop_codon:yes gene_type:complete